MEEIQKYKFKKLGYVNPLSSWSNWGKVEIHHEKDIIVLPKSIKTMNFMLDYPSILFNTKRVNPELFKLAIEKSDFEIFASVPLYETNAERITGMCIVHFKRAFVDYTSPVGFEESKPDEILFQVTPRPCDKDSRPEDIEFILASLQEGNSLLADQYYN